LFVLGRFRPAPVQGRPSVRRRSSNALAAINPGVSVRRNNSSPAQIIGDALPVSLTPRRAACLAFALLLLALSALLLRPAPSLARATSTCSSSAAARAKTHVRACAGRHSSAKAHAKVKGHHAKHNHSKKKAQAKRKSAHAPAAVQRPATCEDGTTPTRDSEGGFACGDGSEPVCANGAEPVAKRTAGRPLCPVASGSGTEFSEAACEDGSAPERAAGSGTYGCEDGSRPSCEDGSQPTLSDDGSMLVCIAHGAPGSSTPPAEEGEEAEAEEAEEDSRRASA
jgi:hypothetical protein